MGRVFFVWLCLRSHREPGKKASHQSGANGNAAFLGFRYHRRYERMKDLIEVKFTPINDGEASAVIVKQVFCTSNNYKNLVLSIISFFLNVVDLTGFGRPG